MSDSIAGAAGQERWMPAMLALARELWVMRDRQRVLEQLLAEHGVLPAGAADAWQPDAVQQAAIDAECRRFVQSLVDQFLVDPPDVAQSGMGQSGMGQSGLGQSGARARDATGAA